MSSICNCGNGIAYYYIISYFCNSYVYYHVLLAEFNFRSLASPTRTTLTYDDENRVTGITYPSSATNSFAYNGLGLRVSKNDSAGAFAYVCDGTDVASAVLKDGKATFTPGLSERRGTVSKFTHKDALGSTRGITDTAQATTDAILYDAFGMTVSRTGTTPTPFGFVGGAQYQTDADSGLMLLGHRYYDASIGRFISEDPIQAGTNWYAYCDNNPLKAIDPSGLFADGDIAWHWVHDGDGYTKPKKPRPKKPSKPAIPPIDPELIHKAIEIGKQVIGDTNENNREHGGTIHKIGGKYSTTDPSYAEGSGEIRGTGPAPPGGDPNNSKANWHSHPANSTNAEVADYASDTDISMTNNEGIPTFIISGNGDVFIIKLGVTYPKVPGVANSYRIPKVGHIPREDR